MEDELENMAEVYGDLDNFEKKIKNQFGGPVPGAEDSDSSEEDDRVVDRNDPVSLLT